MPHGAVDGTLVHPAATAAELDLLLDAQEFPDPLDLLVVQMVLDPIGPVIERRLHVAGEELLPFDLARLAQLSLSSGSAAARHASTVTEHETRSAMARAQQRHHGVPREKSPPNQLHNNGENCFVCQPWQGLSMTVLHALSQSAE